MPIVITGALINHGGPVQSWSDPTPIPTSPSDAQIQAEAQAVA